MEPAPFTLSLIAACARNRVIGRNGRLAFRLDADRRWFEGHTAGKTLVLGRLCYEAWPGAGLDGRKPIVVTSRPETLASRPRPARAVAPSAAPGVDAALAEARRAGGETMVCGGQRIYEETLPLADRLVLTLVDVEAEGDRWFPDWTHLSWRETYAERGTERGVGYTFLILERRRG